ncbi:hypothetical protein [Streptomyces cathayae]|uniref:Uncharacterized protein n=1 Tax=Streptomyces cathayae TaxID=3031124 RepID=A0ABY8KEN0_9ACTN|nr:hypothetical protein [Streptomyces sp. HUAS 5]WGD45246.1 hypothetical protein PYS65_34845 [Streptomyces sp. HUAS 5]
MSACIISCATPDAAQERGFAARIGPGDHQQWHPVGVDVVADHPLLAAQTQAGVVEAAAAQGGRSSGQSCGEGEAERLLLGRKPLMEVQAAHVEAELGAVPLE